MLFNSLDFAFFLPIVFLLYWLVIGKDRKAQNLFVVGASYFFYACWDWRFLGLILASTIIDFSLGKAMGRETDQGRRKLLLWTSVLVNLSLLGFFKYFNFFIQNFTEAFSFFGAPVTGFSLKIILPVGISFYTFQTLSYSIDVYRKKLPPTHDFFAFAAFVSFFPQLVAGPIERATNLLPQFLKPRAFDYEKAIDGLRQILWGFFKKIVIADNCAPLVNAIFQNPEQQSGSTLLLGAILFAFQIYGDFSGYSDIAIGTARLFGVHLRQNFAFPYFSRDIAEFWRRWHISLSTWFRDYLYIPLGGSRGGMLLTVVNVFIIFVVSGFWHGAKWTFVIWGLLNACYFLPLLLGKRNRRHLGAVAQGRLFPTINEFVQILFTFGLTTFAWIFFRADDLTHAFVYIDHLFSWSFWSVPDYFSKKVPGLLVFFIGIEWLGRADEYAIEKLMDSWTRPVRWAFYYALLFIIILFIENQETFIYFQF